MEEDNVDGDVRNRYVLQIFAFAPQAAAKRASRRAV